MNRELIIPYRIMMIEPIGDGGITHYAYNLLNALINRGIKIKLVTAKDYEFINDKHVSFEVSNKMFRVASYLIKLNPWFDKESRLPSFVRRTIKMLEYPINTVTILCEAIIKKIQIVHLQSVNLIDLLVVIASRIINKKVIFTIHNVMPRHQKLYFYHRVLYRIMYSLCNEVIIHSEKGKKEIVDLYNVFSEKIHVIPHGDYKFFVPEKRLSKSEAKLELGISSNTKTILFFGAIRKNKGLKNIINAIPYIKKQIPDIKLMIVGEPLSAYNHYKEMISKLKIGSEVYEKLDYVPNEDVARYFTPADLVILPYDEITQSGILQIAYAFAKPVVATDLGGFKEAIENGKNGYLVPVGDIQGLAERCVEILIDEKKLRRMGEHSRFLSDTKYSWDSIAEKTIKVYQRCMA